MIETAEATGSLSVLNTGAGDIEVTFNRFDDAESARAVKMLTDMQQRGYAILVRLDDGTYARATRIDAERGRYIIQLPASDVALAGQEAEVVMKRKRGRPRKNAKGAVEETVTVSTPVRSRKATGVARSAGG